MVDEDQFEQQLALYCAPVLKKKKIAGMFHVKPTDLSDLERLIYHYNEVLNTKGISLTLLQTKPRATSLCLSTKSTQTTIKAS